MPHCSLACVSTPGLKEMIRIGQSARFLGLQARMPHAAPELAPEGPRGRHARHKGRGGITSYRRHHPTEKRAAQPPTRLPHQTPTCFGPDSTAGMGLPLPLFGTPEP